MHWKIEKIRKNDKGITLIALVITIIVLLILATISVNTLMGDNGILTKASEAKEKYLHASVTEAISLAYIEYENNGLTVEDNVRDPDIDMNMLQSHLFRKVASLKIAPLIIQPEPQPYDFLVFLKEKGYSNDNNVINIEKLLGNKSSFGNGNETETKDVYKIEKEEGMIKSKYILKYYDKEGKYIVLWQMEENATVPGILS